MSGAAVVTDTGADPRRSGHLLVLGVCVAVAAVYLLPATYNYVITPIVDTFGVQGSESSLVRQLPNIASLLVIFVAGVAGSRWGERRVMVAGGVLLAGGNALAALAPVFPVLVVGLSVQAIGSTLLMVVSLAVLGARIREPRARTTAFASFSMVSPVVFVVLPVVAGLLLQYTSWRVLVGMWALGGVAAVAATVWLVPGDEGGRSRSELVTPLLAGVVCLALVQAVSNVHVDGTVSTATLVRLAVAVVALVALVVTFRASAHPSLSVVPLRQAGAVLLLVVVALWCFTQVWYYMTIAYEYVFGLSVLWTAIAMVPAQVSAVVGARVAGRMVRGMGVTACGVVLLAGVGLSTLGGVALSVDSPLWLVIVLTCLYSFTSMGAGVPLTNAIMDAAPSDQGSASAYRAAAISMGSVVGIALVSALVFSVFASTLRSELAAAGLPTDPAAQVAAALRAGTSSEQASAVYSVPLSEVDEIDQMQQVAMMAGVDAQNWSAAAFSFLTAGAFVVARRRRRLGSSHTALDTGA